MACDPSEILFPTGTCLVIQINYKLQIISHPDLKHFLSSICSDALILAYLPPRFFQSLANISIPLAWINPFICHSLHDIISYCLHHWYQWLLSRFHDCLIKSIAHVIQQHVTYRIGP